METIQRNMDPNRLQLRKKLRQQIQWGRMGLLVILAVSLLNQILLLCKVNYHFHFSAALPYYLNWLSRQMGLDGFKAMAVRALLWVMMMTVMPVDRPVSCNSFRMALPVW